MLTFLASRWRELLSGVLFRPVLVALGFAGLAVALPTIDATWDGLPFSFGGDAAAARSVLSTIAASLITVAALSFSLMIVTLQLVSSQFTPRAIRGLLANGTNQLTIGTFVGIFMYCLLVLRLVRDGEPVPSMSVGVGIAMGVGGLLLLVVFIHNLSQSIMVSRIAARLCRETLDAIDDLYPERYGSASREDAPGRIEDGRRINAWRSGYVQRIHTDALVSAARAPMHVLARPGDFVTPSTPLVAVACSEDVPGVRDAVRKAVHLTEEREIDQDSAYGMRQLTDMALRALSPGINDPSTAVTCIHYLGACLQELARRDIPAVRRLRSPAGCDVLIERVTFEEHLQEAFEELVTASSRNSRVARELIGALEGGARAAVDARADERVQAISSVARATARSESASG